MRLTLVSLLLIPLLSLAVLSAFTASITLGDVLGYQHYDTVENRVAPSIPVVLETVPVESAITVAWLGSGRQPGPAQAELAAVRHRTDAEVPVIRHAVTSVRGLLDAKSAALLDVFLADLARLGQIRAAVDSGSSGTAAAFAAYSGITADGIQFFQNSTPPADPNLGVMTQSAVADIRAEEFTGEAVSLIGAAMAAGGAMSQPERVLFDQVTGKQNLEISEMFALANPVLTALYARQYRTPAYRGLQAAENQVEASPVSRPVPVNPTAAS